MIVSDVEKSVALKPKRLMNLKVEANCAHIFVCLLFVIFKAKAKAEAKEV
jgi:hypothetical protein